MKSVRQKHTTPELVLRKAIFARGYRFRLHPRNLAGRPDITLPKHKTAIFVHGCFWHGHQCKHGRIVPKTNTAFWIEKIQRNRERDSRKEQQLKDAGWGVLVVWECEIRTGKALDYVLQELSEGKLKTAAARRRVRG